MTLFPRIKRLLPSSLFGRALLILVLPVVLAQLVAVYAFYERHWDSLVRNMSASLAGEVAILVQELRNEPEEERAYRARLFEELLSMRISFGERDAFVPASPADNARFHEFLYHVGQDINYPISVTQPGGGEHLHIAVQMEDMTLYINVSKKRLVSSTTFIFVIWMAGSSVILLAIAILFLRNQIRPITQLARAAEGFGLGRDDPAFRPTGAREVRQAAQAFLTMRARIRRQMENRTAMLSGISHDLRTPLTRMKLQLAMLEDAASADALQQDVEEMEHMLQEYIDYIRGEGSEEPTEVDLASYVELIMGAYQRSGQPVTCTIDSSAHLSLKRRAFRRALDNIIGNGLRYGVRCHVTLNASDKYVTVSVEDHGPGIPEEFFEHVFKPFKRLDPSRNVSTGGVGLGLTIARDIIQAHGGDIILRNRTSEDGRLCGLQVIIRLPLKKA